MKINRISLNCQQGSSVNDCSGTDSMLFYFKSPVTFMINGRECRLKKNSAVIFSSYKQPFHSTDNRPLRYDCVSFRMSAADKQYISSMNLPLDTPIEITDDFVISGLLKCMKVQSLNKGKHSGEFMELSMRMIFISISDGLNTHKDNLADQIPRYYELKILREAIYANPESEWSVDKISAEFGISRTYFHRLYLAAFGITCRQDIIESRLLYAADLLKNTDLSVSAIAERCGYESDSYFMRQFKQHKGFTPSEYRRHCSEAAE